MMLEQRLTQAEADLAKVGTAVETLSAESRSTIARDHEELRKVLLVTVRVIEDAQALLLTEDNTTVPLPGAFPSDDHAVSSGLLTQKLRILESRASDAYNNVAEFYARAQDLFVDLEMIQEEIRAISVESEKRIKISERAICAKKSERDTAQSNMQQCVNEKLEIAGKAEDNRDVRIGLRVGRVVAWGASLAFPPMGVVAAGLEIGAHKVRKKARELEAQWEAHQLRYNSLKQEIAELGTSIKILQRNGTSTEELSTKCDQIYRELKVYLDQMEEKMRVMVNVKRESDKFRATSASWKTKAEFMDKIEDDREVYELTLSKLLEDVALTAKPRTSAGYITMGDTPSGQGLTISELLGMRQQHDVVNIF